MPKDNKPKFKLNSVPKSRQEAEAKLEKERIIELNKSKEQKNKERIEKALSKMERNTENTSEIYKGKATGKGALEPSYPETLLFPGSLPFKAASKLGKAALFTAEQLNPVGGMRSLKGVAKEATKKTKSVKDKLLSGSEEVVANNGVDVDYDAAIRRRNNTSSRRSPSSQIKHELRQLERDISINTLNSKPALKLRNVILEQLNKLDTKPGSLFSDENLKHFEKTGLLHGKDGTLISNNDIESMFIGRAGQGRLRNYLADRFLSNKKLGKKIQVEDPPGGIDIDNLGGVSDHYVNFLSKDRSFKSNVKLPKDGKPGEFSNFGFFNDNAYSAGKTAVNLDKLITNLPGQWNFQPGSLSGDSYPMWSKIINSRNKNKDQFGIDIIDWAHLNSFGRNTKLSKLYKDRYNEDEFGNFVFNKDLDIANALSSELDNIAETTSKNWNVSKDKLKGPSIGAEVGTPIFPKITLKKKFKKGGKLNKYDGGGKLKEALSIGFNDGTELPSATTNKPFFGTALRGPKQDVIPNSAENSIINFNRDAMNSDGGNSTKVFKDKKLFDKANQAYTDSLNVWKGGNGSIKQLKDLEKVIKDPVIFGNTWHDLVEKAMQNNIFKKALESYKNLTILNGEGPQPINSYTSIINSNNGAYEYKKPTQKPVYQPNEAVDFNAVKNDIYSDDELIGYSTQSELNRLRSDINMEEVFAPGSGKSLGFRKKKVLEQSKPTINKKQVDPITPLGLDNPDAIEPKLLKPAQITEPSTSRVQDSRTYTGAKYLEKMKRPTKYINTGNQQGREEFDLGGIIKSLGKLAQQPTYDSVGRMTSNYGQEALMGFLGSSLDTLTNTVNKVGGAAMGMMEDGGPLTHYKGNTHDNGGIPLGEKVEVEDGETRIGDFIFSNNIKYNKKMTYASKSKKIEKQYSKRDNDPLTDSALKRDLEDLAQEQENTKMMTNSRERLKTLMMKYGGRLKMDPGGEIPEGSLKMDSSYATLMKPKKPKGKFADIFTDANNFLSSNPNAFKEETLKNQKPESLINGPSLANLGVQGLGDLYNVLQGLKGGDDVYFEKPEIERLMGNRAGVAGRLGVRNAFAGVNSSLRNTASGKGEYMANRIASGSQEAQKLGEVGLQTNLQVDTYNNQLINNNRNIRAQIQQQEAIARQQEIDAARSAVSSGLQGFGSKVGGYNQAKSQANMDNSMIGMITPDGYELIVEKNGTLKWKNKKTGQSLPYNFKEGNVFGN